MKQSLIKYTSSRWIYILFTCIVLFANTTLQAQILNDECRFATPLPAVEEYCSDDGAFTNIGATPDPQFPNSCVSLRWQNGVWFSFTPRRPGALIRAFGAGQGGTMRSPKIVVFSRCGEYLQCSPGKGVGNDELLLDNLVVGQLYYIMIESAVDGAGTFKLCVSDFAPVPSPESDCRDGVVLCDKSTFIVQSLTGLGQDRNEIERGNCMQEEFQSAWYKWTCDEAGSLTFVLTPNDFVDRNTISDDLDFAVYELPNGLDDCGNKRLIRCMASGANGDGNGNALPLAQWIGCNGPTGLLEGDVDIVENPGCQPGNNNFLAPIDMVAGRSYVLIVNNFTRSGLGFQVEFGGTGTFLGPKPDFELNANNAFECDKSVVITNLSESLTDPIVRYNWNFGDRATPDRSNGEGPFDVTYGSFGNKIAALTVESSRGCLVTKIVEFFVEPCCKDTSTLNVDADLTNLRCFNVPEGIILGIGVGGAPEYQFSLNGGSFRSNPRYGNLPEGLYTLAIQDSKGCMTEIEINLVQPPQLIVNAGIDQEIELCDPAQLMGSYTPVNPLGDSITWTPSQDFENNSILDPVVFPRDNTTYTLTVVDQNGCSASDQVTVSVDPMPNVIDAGPDQVIDLGETAQLLGSYTRLNSSSVSIRWVPTSDFENDSILNPVVFPKDNTTYTFIVTDERGCEVMDQVTIRVNKDYQVHLPNVIKPSSQLGNAFFNIWHNRSVKYVELLEVYDRWGNLVYRGKDCEINAFEGCLTTNDNNNGWNGVFRGRSVNPGVFAWRAQVRFIDETVHNFAGDLTVLDARND